MAYIERKKLGGETYFYLVKNVRSGDGFKKFRLYLGKNLGQSDVGSVVGRKSGILEQKAREYLKLVDPMFSLLSEGELKTLEQVRAAHRNFLAKASGIVRQKYYEWFMTNFTYDTNSIEGSTITLQETSMILFDRISPPGRTLREIAEVENHRKAFDLVLAYKGDLTKQFILKLHRVLSKGIIAESGKLRTVQVYIRGEAQLPPKPELVEEELGNLLKWYKKNKKKYHPVISASYFHTAFEAIHPFVDFNGRTGRLLLNFILLKKGFPAVDIKTRERGRYYAALKASIKRSQLRPFIELLLKCLKGQADVLT